MPYHNTIILICQLNDKRKLYANDYTKLHFDNVKINFKYNIISLFLGAINNILSQDEKNI